MNVRNRLKHIWDNLRIDEGLGVRYAPVKWRSQNGGVNMQWQCIPWWLVWLMVWCNVVTVTQTWSPLWKVSNQYQGTTSDDKGVGKCSVGCLKSAKRSLEDSSWLKALSWFANVCHTSPFAYSFNLEVSSVSDCDIGMMVRIRGWFFWWIIRSYALMMPEG